MPAVSRKGDSLSTGHICTSTTTLDTPAQGTCFANSILIARVSDPTVSHPFHHYHLVRLMLLMLMLEVVLLELQVVQSQE